MRTLDEITAAVRLYGLEGVTPAELLYAVVAYDVLMARLDVTQNAVQLQTYFEAAETDVAEYVGPNNDPSQPGARDWYRAMRYAGRAPVICENCDMPVPPGCSGEFAEQRACVGFYEVPPDAG